MEISTVCFRAREAGRRQGAYSLIETASGHSAAHFELRSDVAPGPRRANASLRTAKKTSLPFAIGPLPTGRAQTSTEQLGFQLFAIRELRTYAVIGDWGAS